MGSGLILLVLLLPYLDKVWRSVDDSPLLGWVVNLGILGDRVQIRSLQLHLYIKMTKQSSSDSS